jgi:putative hydrolase of the HAD superfamily
MKTTVLFDLGNTLVHYFERHEFRAILKEAIINVQNCLIESGVLHVSMDDLWSRVEKEDYEYSDNRVRPLEERLMRIFQLESLTQPKNIVTTMCRCFMEPIFAKAYCYEDTLPTLEKLRSEGYKTAIVSNTTWGSPAYLWREHLERLGLSSHVDDIVFCRDVGWRKPAKQIFEYAMQKLQVIPQQCVFVGDDPRWDVVGPHAVGIDTILIDRKSSIKNVEKELIIESLNELAGKLKHFIN